MNSSRYADTRRSFLRKGSAAFALGLTGSGVSSMLSSGCSTTQVASDGASAEDHTAHAASATDYGPFKVGFQSWSLRHFVPLEDFLEQAQRLPVEYVELYRAHLPSDAAAAQVDAMKAGLKAVGLTPLAYGVQRFTADHTQNEAIFRFAKALGLMNVTANPDVDALGSLEKLTQQYDIRIAIHNHGPETIEAGLPWHEPEAILNAVKDLDPRMGTCVDVGHYIRVGVDPVKAIEMLGSRVFGAHLTDFTDPKHNSRQDVILGQGMLHLEATLAALNAVGCDGPLSLEYGSHQEDPISQMQAGLAAVRDAARRV